MPERDLSTMLASLAATRRAGRYVFVSLPRHDPQLAAQADAIVREDEGITYLVREECVPAGAGQDDFRAAWLTLDVHSALDAVGLTAAVAAALTEAGIACNVIAGKHHDHLLVDAARCDDALAALDGLRRRHAPA